MINTFNAKVACDFDPLISIFIQELAQWTFYNLANKRNIHDGYCWSHNTLDAYSTIFPWWSKRQVETLINRAVKAGLVIKGNYNKNKYDRTCWYALSYMGLSYFPELYTEDHLKAMSSTISHIPEMETKGMDENQIAFFHFTYMRNGIHTYVTPIPSNLPSCEISKDISSECSNSSLKQKKVKTTNLGLEDLQSDNPNNIPEQMLMEWLDIRKDKKSRVTQTCWNKINRTLVNIKLSLNIEPITAFETMVDKCWQSLDLKYFKDDKPRNGKPKQKLACL